MKFSGFTSTVSLFLFINFAQLAAARTLDICDQENLRTDRHRITSCASNFICQVECRNYYVRHGSGISRCVDGKFTSVECNLNATLVRECENSEFRSCPYTIKAVLEHYKKNQLSWVNLNRNDMQTLLNFNQRNFLSNCNRFCRRHRITQNFVQPKSCGRLTNSYNRNVCLNCRFNGGCKVPFFIKPSLVPPLITN